MLGLYNERKILDACILLRTLLTNEYTGKRMHTCTSEKTSLVFISFSASLDLNGAIKIPTSVYTVCVDVSVNV